jgi:hypothetical protein
MSAEPVRARLPEPTGQLLGGRHIEPQTLDGAGNGNRYQCFQALPGIGRILGQTSVLVAGDSQTLRLNQNSTPCQAQLTPQTQQCIP